MKLADLDYADDIALFEETDVEMAKTTEAIRATAGKLDLQMSYKKTAIMSVGQASVPNPIVLLGNEGLIKVVDNFKYLAAFCSANGTNFKELNSRIGRASAALRELYKVWRDCNINSKDTSKLEMGWTIEEVEVAARERIMWRHFSSQAANAAMHDAIQ